MKAHNIEQQEASFTSSTLVELSELCTLKYQDNKGKVLNCIEADQKYTKRKKWKLLQLKKPTTKKLKIGNMSLFETKILKIGNIVIT